MKIALVLSAAIWKAAKGDDKGPNYHGCLNDVAKRFEYCDTTLSHEERAEVSSLAFEGVSMKERKEERKEERKRKKERKKKKKKDDDVCVHSPYSLARTLALRAC